MKVKYINKMGLILNIFMTNIFLLSRITDLPIFNRKQWTTTLYLVFKCEENRAKIATVRAPLRKITKWPLWRYQIRIIKKSRKQISQVNFCEIIVVYDNGHIFTIKMTTLLSWFLLCNFFLKIKNLISVNFAHSL